MVRGKTTKGENRGGRGLRFGVDHLTDRSFEAVQICHGRTEAGR